MNVYFCNCDICMLLGILFTICEQSQATKETLLTPTCVWSFFVANLCLIPCTETLSLNTGSMISVNLCGSWIVVSRESFWKTQGWKTSSNQAERNIAWRCCEGLPAPWAPWPARCIARSISPSSLLILLPLPRRSGGKTWLIVLLYNKSWSFTQIDKF